MEIIINKFGYHEVAEKPTKEVLADYYANKYYQSDSAGYTEQYSELELQYFDSLLRRKLTLISPFLPSASQQSLLDVGCGEGFTLPFFAKRGWQVLGADFSQHAIQNHHPDYVDRFLPGDILETLEALRSEHRQFSVIWLDNVLEHVLDPLQLLNQCRDITLPGGLILIDVPNDFSSLQQEARRQGLIERNFWLVLPDHLSYFNKHGLQNLAAEAGWEHCRTVSDYPIDFNLFHPLGNYVQDRSRGKAAHQQRMLLDVFLTAQDAEKTLNLYQALADLGIGRSIHSVFRKQP